MKMTIAAVRNGEMRLLHASKVFWVPRTTLQGKAKSKEINLEKLVDPRLGRQPYLSKDLEEELVQSARENDGASAMEIKKMVFQFSEKTGLHHPFNKDDRVAGSKWFDLSQKGRNKRCRIRGSWAKGDMKEAIAAVRKGEMAVLRASRVFGVPRSTLQCKVKSKETNLEKLVDPRRGPQPYLSEDLEEELVQFACDNDGATATEIKKKAFQLSEKMGLHHPFNKDDGTAGRKWFQSFKKRHPEVAVRRQRRPFT